MPPAEEAVSSQATIGDPIPAACLAWLLATACLLVSTSTRADDVRDFNADTPGKSYSPYTVAKGYFQVESDIVHVTDMGNTQMIESLDPVIKYGLTDNLDLELQTGGLITMFAKTGDKTIASSGYGDLTPEVKYNVFGNDGQTISVALKAGIKLPTASRGFGNGAVEYYFIAPVQIGLPAGFSLQVQQEIDVLKNQNDGGHHFSYAEDLSLGRSFHKVSISAELFAQSGTDPDNPPYYTADVGLGYALTPTSVLSVGLYVGLNKYAPNIEGYTGFGFRF